MSGKKDYSMDKDFLDWYSKQEIQKLSSSQQKNVDVEMQRTVCGEVDFLKKLSVQHYGLAHKQAELQEWVAKTPAHQIEWVKRLVWKPHGKSDFRRISPQLIRVNESIKIPSYNIWGEESLRELDNPEPLSKHWDILRTLVSSATNDGTVGRQMRFLVVDKNTKTYLGVICISSAMFRITQIHQEIGWDQAKNSKRGGKLVCLGNGQTIVPTQPFGNAFLGGKLLSLLCLSKDVADAWEQEYGDKLVGIHTTSLYGTSRGTQYDNLMPYWSKLKDTEGKTAVKPRRHVYDAMIKWLRQRYPQDYYRLYVEKGPNGMLNVRENKTIAIGECYQRFGLKRTDYESKFERGVYSAFLYKNSKEFLRDEIEQGELIPAFDNSVDALTEFWKYGLMGDTTKPTEEIRSKEKKPERIKRKVQMKGMVKGNIDARSPDRPIPIQGRGIDWYLPLHSMSWDEIQMQYPNPPVLTETL
jgi:hypothetical protein